MSKQISIVVAGSEKILDISITPGSTVSQVLESAGLNNYLLAKKGGEPLEAGTDLFENSTQFEKFYASPSDITVGEV